MSNLSLYRRGPEFSWSRPAGLPAWLPISHMHDLNHVGVLTATIPKHVQQGIHNDMCQLQHVLRDDTPQRRPKMSYPWGCSKLPATAAYSASQNSDIAFGCWVQLSPPLILPFAAAFSCCALCTCKVKWLKGYVVTRQPGVAPETS